MSEPSDVESGGLPRALVILGPGNSHEWFSSLLDSVAEVEFASAIEEGLTKLRQETADLIVLVLPSEPSDVGAALLRLKADPVAAEIPVAVFTPQRDEATAVRCLQLGAEYAYQEMGWNETSARLVRSVFLARRDRSLAHQAQTDALTGLANYGAFRSRLEQEFRRAIRYEYPISMVMIDLDHLKGINDRFGHAVGNCAIVAVASHLMKGTRETDFAARFGGDEFVLLLPYQTPSEAGVLAERLRQGLKGVRVFTEQRERLTLTISAGIAGHSVLHPMQDPHELLLAADAALQAGKNEGRDRVVIFEPPSVESGLRAS